MFFWCLRAPVDLYLRLIARLLQCRRLMMRSIFVMITYSIVGWHHLTSRVEFLVCFSSLLSDIINDRFDVFRLLQVNERWRNAIRFEFHAFRWAHRARRVEVASKRTAAKRLTWRRAAKVSPKLSAVADMCVAVKCIPCAKRRNSVQFQPQHRRRARVIEVITWVDCPFHTEIVNFSQIFARLSRNIRILYASKSLIDSSHICLTLHTRASARFCWALKTSIITDRRRKHRVSTARAAVRALRNISWARTIQTWFWSRIFTTIASSRH